nr:immunoglobulin heavy chain junction region [Mus musculus]
CARQGYYGFAYW